MLPSSGTVGPTPAEQSATAIAAAQFEQYQSKWLPVQDKFATIISSMAAPNSWQRQEAEGKGNADVADAAAKQSTVRNAAELSHGINVNSGTFKFGITGAATAEAAAKGAAINTGNQAIDKAYLGGLSAITATGEQLANTAVQGAGTAGEVASREAISAAQLSNANSAATAGLIGMGLGAATAGLTRPAPAYNPTTGAGAGQGYGQFAAPGVQAPVNLGLQSADEPF